jgi:hypothetical protein
MDISAGPVGRPQLFYSWSSRRPGLLALLSFEDYIVV